MRTVDIVNKFNKQIYSSTITCFPENCIFFSLDEENWRGKNRKIKTVARSRRAIQSMLNPMANLCHSIMLLRNGYFSTFGQYSIQTINTCSFDSFYTIVAAMYTDYTEVKKQIDDYKQHNKFSEMVSEMFNNTGSLQVKQNKLLKLRNLVLLDALQNITESFQLNNGLVSIDCANNCNYIIPKLLPAEMYSYIRKKRCFQCNRYSESNRCFEDIEYIQFRIRKI